MQSQTFWNINITENYESENTCEIKLYNIRQLSPIDTPKELSIDLYDTRGQSYRYGDIMLDGKDIKQSCSITTDHVRISIEEILNNIPSNSNEATIKICFVHSGAIKKIMEELFLAEYNFKTLFPYSTGIDMIIDVPLAKNKFKRFLVNKFPYFFRDKGHWLPIPINYPGAVSQGMPDPTKSGRIKYSCAQLDAKIGFIYAEPRLTRTTNLIVGGILGAGVGIGFKELIEFLISLVKK